MHVCLPYHTLLDESNRKYCQEKLSQGYLQIVSSLIKTMQPFLNLQHSPKGPNLDFRIDSQPFYEQKNDSFRRGDIRKSRFLQNLGISWNFLLQCIIVLEIGYLLMQVWLLDHDGQIHELDKTYAVYQFVLERHLVNETYYVTKNTIYFWQNRVVPSYL